MAAPSLCSEQRGFSFLEVLIALTLMSFLFLALFSSFTTIARGWDAAEKRMLHTEDMRLISDFLRNQLRQMMVVRIQGDGERIYAFDGTDYYVRYAAPLQPLQYQGGIYLIELSVASDRHGRKLQMRYAPYRPDLTWDEALGQTEPVLVYDHIRSARFEYYAADSDLEEPRWQSQWLNKPVYPLLIKIVIEGEDHNLWPEIVSSLPQVDAYVGTVMP